MRLLERKLSYNIEFQHFFIYLLFIDKKKHAEDKPEIAPFDGKNRDYYEKPKPKQKTKKFQGQGVMIGTKNQNYADEYDTKEVPKQVFD